MARHRRHPTLRHHPHPGRRVTRAKLDEALAQMRRYRHDDALLLVGRALPPWMVRWVEDNGVEHRDHPNAPLGMAYLINESAIDTVPNA